MCGINGYISFSSDVNTEIVHTMNSSVLHRGPDSQDVWSGEKCALGHVRLSIIDLSERSNQPLVKDNLAIVFNGEIYNFKQLRTTLADTLFLTDSDTEVVLEMWRRHGPGALNMLRGMFSFAIHDSTTNETFIVRDQFGIKPLFYHESTSGLIFSSELKAIEYAAPYQLRLDDAALVASMVYAWIPEEYCILSGVRKLPPGTYLRIGPTAVIEEVRYWSARSLLSQTINMTRERPAADYLSNVLENSVKAHLVSDVPVNAFLSGGLDSSLLVSMARRHLESLDCYTIKFSPQDRKHEAMADDAYYADKVAKHLGVKLNVIEVKPDLATLLPKVVHHLDEPIGDSAAINTFLICEVAQQAGVKVLLSGMGADEIFAGYRKHLANRFAERYRAIPVPLRQFIEKPIGELSVASRGKGNKVVRWAKRFFSFAGLPEADAFLRSYTYYDFQSLCDAFEKDISSELNDIKENHHAVFNYARNERDLIDTMCFTDVNKFMVSLNLTYSDRASMAASTEIRVPFIDLEVMKAAFAIDGGLKLKGRTQKHILKRVAERWLPHDVIYRPKSSFTMPIRAWIKNDLRDLVSDYLLSAEGLAGRRIIKPQFIKKLIDDEMTGREDNAQRIWHLLTLEQWLRNHGL